MLRPLSRCYQSRRLRPPSLPAALIQAPFCSLSLYPSFRMWVLDGDPGKAASPAVPGARREQQPGGQLARSSPAFCGGRGGKEALEKPLDQSSAKPQGLSQRSLQLQESFPSLSRQGQDLRFVFPQQLEAGLPSVEGFAPSSPSQLLEGAQMDKSKHRGRCGHP